MAALDSKIGIINPLENGGDCFGPVLHYALSVCQLVSWDISQATEEIAFTVKAAADKAGVRIAAMWAGVPGPQVWNFVEGPLTLGIVPQAYRAERVAALKRWADFAARIGAPAIITHCGFIPENMTDPEYPAVVEAIREVAQYCLDRGLEFWLETGQETPVVLLRTIERVGTGNLGLNFDPANLIMYGKGNPIDALDTVGDYVRNIHVKDGLYPVSGDLLGAEVRPGLGRVRFPEFVGKLTELGFAGDWIIEREIHGEQQEKDIRSTIADLNRWAQAADSKSGE
ncbi:sugar phosphate isomerase/epimerase [Cohnella sp. GbtcB17]|uniref:sugar phosphate isomerase/epimerase family protein n=1 Tax=Cohnella sp. GbtcB17 TaxID=2824762 RepID=UPI001C2FA321|nr:sugar phosphate isomerase/epimerase family protein [Cohnella sp. GbtcB17]